jgi:hypothetical protein
MRKRDSQSRYTCAMTRSRRATRDSHPRLLINAQILWIIVGFGLVDKWLPRVAINWRAGETYNLPQGIEYVVIGFVIVVINFILVNSSVRQLQSKLASNLEPSESDRPMLSPPNAL